MSGIQGYFTGIPFVCEVLPIKDEDTLVIKVDQEKVNMDTSVELYDGICKMYPNNKVIFLFEGMTLVKEQEDNDG